MEGHKMIPLINQLPPEVLSRIFVLGNALSGGYRNARQDDAFRGRILRVCRYWKNVALDTAGLWSYITVSGRPPYRQAMCKAERAKYYSSLHMSFNFSTLPYHMGWQGLGRRAERIGQLVPEIARRGAAFDRWKSLRIITQSLLEANTILNSLDKDGMSLEALRIRITRLSLDGRDRKELDKNFVETLLSLFYSSPQLREFSMVGIEATVPIETYSPLKNLTRLELVRCKMHGMNHFHQLLSDNPRLEVLILKGLYTSDGTSIPSMPVISFNDLQTLQLADSISSWLSPTLLRAIDAPNLTSLGINIGGWPDKLESTLLMEFLCSEECTFTTAALRRLSIGLFRCDSRLFLKLFTKCSGLTRLDWVVEQNKTHSLILSHPPWLLTKLSHMRIASATMEVPLDYILEQTVFGRRDAGLPLRFLEVDGRTWSAVSAHTQTLLRNSLPDVGPAKSTLKIDEETSSIDEQLSDVNSEGSSSSDEE
ncbi:Serine/threonine-protein kinase [Ceratobasidium sp. AG-Ba]|nr:Serine/threonine-protein kinase [Ceratobasidium sp. AG-Ba]